MAYLYRTRLGQAPRAYVLTDTRTGRYQRLLIPYAEGIDLETAHGIDLARTRPQAARLLATWRRGVAADPHYTLTRTPLEATP